jgi:hypothetical protein
MTLGAEVAFIHDFAQSRVEIMFFKLPENVFGRGRAYFLCPRPESWPDLLCGQQNGRIRTILELYAQRLCQIVNYLHQKPHNGRGRAFFLCLRPRARQTGFPRSTWNRTWNPASVFLSIFHIKGE